jgi:hypothetical protein
VDPVPDPLLLGKSGRGRNRTRDLWIYSQEIWPLDHRDGHIYSLIKYIPTLWLLKIRIQKPVIASLVKTLRVFHGTRMITGVFEDAMGPYSDPDEFSLHLPSVHFNIICHLLGVPGSVISPGFLTKFLYTLLFIFIRCTCPAHLIILDLIILIVFDEEYGLWSFCSCSFLR